MSRQKREHVPHSVHHVIQRGNNRNYIYENTRDKREFLEILCHAIDTSDATLLQYVLMDNHYHLLIRVDQQPLSQLLWLVNRNYTRYYNRRYNRIGTIYGGRYKSYLLEEERKLYSTIRYIVRNPVKANMAVTPGAYRWSGHGSVISGQGGIVDRQALLSYFAPEGTLALQRYRECTESDTWHAEAGFATIVQPEIETEERLACLLDGFLEQESLSTYRKMVVSGSRLPVARQLRSRFITLAITDGHALKDIAAFLHVSHETVRRIGKSSFG